MTDPLEFLVPETETVAGNDAVNDRERRELLVAVRCGRTLGVFAAETDGIITWKDPSPLPGARPTVLGLVCVRGRMYTVIDPRELTGTECLDQAAPAAFIVLLGGDGQLALAVEKVNSITEIFVDEIQPHIGGDDRSLFFGQWSDSTGTVGVIDPARIFAAACDDRVIT